MKKDTFVKGTMIVYICLMLVKVLSAVYVIPFYSIIGENGGVLYSYAYNIYNIFDDISTAGIPIAISIIVSEYIALNKINSKIKTYLVAKKLVISLSLVSFLLMFAFAEPIAIFFAGSVKDAFSIADISLVIRVISLCLLVVPYLSIVKGYFQAHKYATFTSYSQVMEQVVRIIIILIGSFIAINVLKYSISIGVSVALMGGFIGAIIALIYLKIKYKKNIKSFDDTKKGTDEAPTTKNIIKKIAAVAIPLVLVSISTDIYNLTDMKLITEGLVNIGYTSEEVGVITSIIATWVPKICVMISAIATGLLATIIPNVTEHFSKNNIEGVNKTFVSGLNTVFFVAIPSAICVFVFSWAIYFIFYGYSSYGGYILRFGVIVNVLYSFQLVSNTVLQSMHKYKIIYINTIAGFIVNALLDLPLIYLFNYIGIQPYLGAQAATMIGNLVSMTIIILYFKKNFNFNYKGCFKYMKKMILPTICLIIITTIGRFFVHLENGYIMVLITAGVPCVIGIGVYLFILYKNGGLELVFGENIINKIFKKKKRVVVEEK